MDSNDRAKAEALSAAGLSEFGVAKEMLLFLPRVFVDMYEELALGALGAGMGVGLNIRTGESRNKVVGLDPNKIVTKDQTSKYIEDLAASSRVSIDKAEQIVSEVMEGFGSESLDVFEDYAHLHGITRLEAKTILINRSYGMEVPENVGHATLIPGMDAYSGSSGDAGVRGIEGGMGNPDVVSDGIGQVENVAVSSSPIVSVGKAQRARVSTSERSQEGRVQRGGAKGAAHGKNPAARTKGVIGDEYALALKEKVDVKLRRIAKEVREELRKIGRIEFDGMGNEVYAWPTNACSACKRVLEAHWKWCPYCRGVAESR